MGYSFSDGLELLVELEIPLDETQLEDFEKKFNLVKEVYEEKHERIDYVGLVNITGVSYVLVSDKNDDSKLLTDFFYQKLKENHDLSAKIREISLREMGIVMHTMN